MINMIKFIINMIKFIINMMLQNHTYKVSLLLTPPTYTWKMEATHGGFLWRILHSFCLHFFYTHTPEENGGKNYGGIKNLTSPGSNPLGSNVGNSFGFSVFSTTIMSRSEHSLRRAFDAWALLFLGLYRMFGSPLRMWFHILRKDLDLNSSVAFVGISFKSL